jgi:peptide/nickel transport system permease protein
LSSAIALLAIVLLALLLVDEARRIGSRNPVRRRFFRQPVAALGLFILAVFAMLALAAPLVTPYPPSRALDIVALQNQPPSLIHPLGTDVYSRDVWSRLVYGARVSLSIGTLAMLVAVTLGSLVGAVAGYLRSWVDAILMRVVDVGLAVPRIFLLLMAIALWERLPLALFILLIGLTGWFTTSRIVRAEVLSLRERDFIGGARALGASSSGTCYRTSPRRSSSPPRWVSAMSCCSRRDSRSSGSASSRRRPPGAT